MAALNCIDSIDDDTPLRLLRIDFAEILDTDLKNLHTMGFDFSIIRWTLELTAYSQNDLEVAFAKLISEELEFLNDSELISWYAELHFDNFQERIEAIMIYIDMEKTLGQIISEIQGDWQPTKEEIEDLRQLNEREFLDDPKNTLPK